MPKLIQINVTANWGSTGKIAEQIGLKAKNAGWDTYYAHGSRYVRPSEHKLIEVGSKATDYFHYLWNSFICGSEGLGSTSPTKRLIERIKEISPDIIHIHNLHGYYINYKVLFEYLNTTDIKVLWTLHDCWALTGHCTNPTIINCDKWKTACEKCPIRYEYPRSITDRSKHDFQLKKRLFSTNKNLTLAPVSSWLASIVKESFLSDHLTVVMHNGVDITQFKNPGYEKYNKFTILGVSSVWDKSKGLQDFSILRDLLPESLYDIIIVGLKEEQVKNLPRGINGITRTESVKELVELYSRANVFVNPTYEDSFPTVNIEALACGTPVITYKTGGSPEAVDEKTGIVVEQGNVNALAEAIKRLKDSPLSSEDCRKRAELHFDKDKCFEEYLKLYNQLVTNYERI